MRGRTNAAAAGGGGGSGSLCYTTIESNVAGKEGQIVICFEDGMTWAEYIDSKYLISVAGQLVIRESMANVGVMAGAGYRVYSSDDSMAFLTDVIREDETYYFS